MAGKLQLGFAPGWTHESGPELTITPLHLTVEPLSHVASYRCSVPKSHSNSSPCCRGKGKKTAPHFNTYAVFTMEKQAQASSISHRSKSEIITAYGPKERHFCGQKAGEQNTDCLQATTLRAEELWRGWRQSGEGGGETTITHSNCPWQEKMQSIQKFIFINIWTSTPRHLGVTAMNKNLSFIESGPCG